DPPRSVEVASRGDAVQERAVQVVDVDDPCAVPVDLVALRSLDPAGDQHPPPDRLDAERRKALREVRIDERAGRVDRIPAAVEDVDLPVAGEVSGVQAGSGWAVRDREAFEV